MGGPCRTKKNMQLFVILKKTANCIRQLAVFFDPINGLVY